MGLRRVGGRGRGWDGGGTLRQYKNRVGLLVEMVWNRVGLLEMVGYRVGLLEVVGNRVGLSEMVGNRVGLFEILKDRSINAC